MERITEATADLFSRSGYLAVSQRDIAIQAKITHAAGRTTSQAARTSCPSASWSWRCGSPPAQRDDVLDLIPANPRSNSSTTIASNRLRRPDHVQFAGERRESPVDADLPQAGPG
ncbi:hypothetical protein ACFVG9_25675 [Saccharothrix carnea]|uniref:helix-turn-helix transcriptional regulator n=1 Tax=Saccharothrix carnea TaxID=1280637 RepID=UPI001160E490